jgi:hypothetical protein
MGFQVVETRSVAVQLGGDVSAHTLGSSQNAAANAKKPRTELSVRGFGDFEEVVDA